MGHWYDKDGEPRHHEGKDGKDTTLREARKLGLFPSVTTIGGIMHKDGLVRWLQEQAALYAGRMAAEYQCDPENIDKSFAWDAINKAKEEMVTAKAEAGTDIHDILEQFLKDPFDVSPEDRKMCYAIAECVKENTGLSLYDDFKAEARFCDTDNGYAGMCDLHTPAGSMVEKWVLDYKTKDAVTEKTRGYPEQAEQLAAYSRGLRVPNARLANIFIPRTPDENGDYFIKFFEHKDQNAWQRFLHQVRLWQVTKKYGPYWEGLVS